MYGTFSDNCPRPFSTASLLALRYQNLLESFSLICFLGYFKWLIQVGSIVEKIQKVVGCKTCTEEQIAAFFKLFLATIV